MKFCVVIGVIGFWTDWHLACLGFGYPRLLSTVLYSELYS